MKLINKKLPMSNMRINGLSCLIFTGMIFFSILLTTNSMAQSFEIASSLKQKLEQYKKHLPKERLMVITDKEVYTPEEIIWYQVYSAELFRSNASDLSDEVLIQLFDVDNTLVLEQKAPFDKTGEGCLQLPQKISSGIYYIMASSNASSGYQYYRKRISIRELEIPKFKVNLRFPDRSYSMGDVCNAELSFSDFYNEPIKNVEFEITFYDGENKVTSVKEKTDNAGIANLKISIPPKLISDVFSYKILAEYKNYFQEFSGFMPVITKAFVNFFPEGGILLDGISTNVSMFAGDGLGDPLQIEGKLYQGDIVIQDIKTNEMGLMDFKITPQATSIYYLMVDKPFKQPVRVHLPQVYKQGISIQNSNQDKGKVTLKVASKYTEPRNVSLVGFSAGEIFWFSDFTIENENEFSVDLGKAKGKIIRFGVFNASLEKEGEICLLNDLYKDVLDVNSEIGADNLTIGETVNLTVSASSFDEAKMTVSVISNSRSAQYTNNANVEMLLYPYDFFRGVIGNSYDFESHIKPFVKYYESELYNWDNILERNTSQNIDIFKYGQGIKDQFIGFFNIIKEEGWITHTNVFSDSYFLTANKKYFSQMYNKEVKQKESYITMLENGTPLIEVINSIKPFNLESNKIVFYGSQNSLMAQDGALIVLDGMKMGTDASLLNQIEPFSVAKIFVSTNPSDIQMYTGLNSVGLIEITTKRGPQLEKEDNYPPCIEFDSWVKEKNRKGLYGKNDYRSTLYWNPSIEIKSGEEVKLSFMNSSLLSNVIGTITVISKDGKIGVKKFEYKIN